MINDGFSIITVTNRNYCIDNLIKNYLNQNFKNKELIVIINNDTIMLEDFYKCYSNPQISIYKLPQETTLGECLNFAISKSKYDFISKFDDDDYYGPYYLNEAYNIFLSISCDVIGKNKTYYYIENLKKLILKNKEIQNTYCSSVMGSSLCFRKEIFTKVRFREVSSREDFFFNRECMKNGFKIFASSQFNHIVFKHSDNNKHTFLSDIDLLMSVCKDIRCNISLEECFDVINRDI